jgi:excisionase family DNA binding protein
MTPGPDAQQLRLEVVPIERRELPHDRRNGSATATKLGPRLALSPDEAARVLGVSRDYFDEHILPELRIIRRGRRILIPLAELERWLDRSAANASVVGRP